jgi:hypothetical protein
MCLVHLVFLEDLDFRRVLVDPKIKSFVFINKIYYSFTGNPFEPGAPERPGYPLDPRRPGTPEYKRSYQS